MNEREGIVIIGVPPGVQPGFISGTISDGIFIRDKLTATALSGEPIGGYLVGKLKATDEKSRFGLWSVYTNILRTVPCGSELLTFPVKAGTVQYVADFSFDDNGRAVSIAHKDNLDGAINYLRKLYPTEKFEVIRTPLTPQMHALPKGQSCGPATIPIYFGY